MDLGFGYLAILKSDSSGEATSVVAHRMASDTPLRAVLWSVPRHSWIYAPALVSRYLYDDAYQDRSEKIDRSSAEAIARDQLGTTLPSEETLRDLCDEGAQMNWDFGPPRG